jgi:hypothetical protein
VKHTVPLHRATLHITPSDPPLALGAAFAHVVVSEVSSNISTDLDNTAVRYLGFSFGVPLSLIISVTPSRLFTRLFALWSKSAWIELINRRTSRFPLLKLRQLFN